MTGATDKLANLFAYIQADGRVCPQPQEWNALWELLPRKERVGGGWRPPLPLILDAWWSSSDGEKQVRLQEHVKYAAAEGVLDTVDSFVRGLRQSQWYTREHQ